MYVGSDTDGDGGVFPELLVPTNWSFCVGWLCVYLINRQCSRFVRPSVSSSVINIIFHFKFNVLTLCCFCCCFVFATPYLVLLPAAVACLYEYVIVLFFLIFFFFFVLFMQHVSFVSLYASTYMPWQEHILCVSTLYSL